MATSGEDASRPYAPQSTGVVYASVLANLSDAANDPVGGYFFHIGADPVGTAFRCRLFAKKDASNNVSFGISRLMQATFTPFTYSLNTTYLLVVKYTIVAGDTNDTVDLFVNPVLGGNEPAATATATDAAAADIIPGTGPLRQDGGEQHQRSELTELRSALLGLILLAAEEEDPRLLRHRLQPHHSQHRPQRRLDRRHRRRLHRHRLSSCSRFE